MIKDFIKKLTLVGLLAAMAMPCDAMQRDVDSDGDEMPPLIECSAEEKAAFAEQNALRKAQEVALRESQEKRDKVTVTYQGVLTFIGLLEVLNVSEVLYDSFLVRIIQLGLRKQIPALFFQLLNDQMEAIYGEGVVVLSDSLNPDKNFPIKIAIKKPVHRSYLNIPYDNQDIKIAMLLDHANNTYSLQQALKCTLDQLEACRAEIMQRLANAKEDQ